MPTMRNCKDCGSATRKLIEQGPRTLRCATCIRERKKERKASSQAGHVERTYNITEEQYQAIYRAQGGRCNGCRIATGASRRLSVDHDHACCPGPVSCGRCIRQLLCRVCNDYLGYIRDNPDALRRLAKAIEHRPAQTILLRF